MLQKDPKKRMTWSQFFQDPVVAYEPQVYQALLPKIIQRPGAYMQRSSQEGQQPGANTAKQIPQDAKHQEPEKQIPAAITEQKASQPENSLEDANLVSSDIVAGDEQQEGRNSAAQANLFVEDLIESQDVTNEVVKSLFQ